VTLSRVPSGGLAPPDGLLEGNRVSTARPLTERRLQCESDRNQKNMKPTNLAAQRPSFLRRARNLALMAAALAVATVNNRADFGTNITNLVDDATTLFTSVSTLVITVVGFGIAIAYIKMVKKK